MKKITVLGAGAMGSAICHPLADAGWDVHLWGTWLDDEIIRLCRQGEPHPRTNVKLHRQVKTYFCDELQEALKQTNAVIVSVSSPGVKRITEMALDAISQAQVLFLTSKGFFEEEDGNVVLLPDCVRAIAAKHGKTLPPIIPIAGPVKANECAEGKPTATIFACRNVEVAKKYAGQIRTDYYRIDYTEDERGLEVCAPMKNVYAIALGVADGLMEKTGIPHHNLKAATFNQAVKEMSIIAKAAGGSRETAFNLPGVGDLEVTGLSGRNKFYGVRLGKGERPDQAWQEMEAAQQTVEGYPATLLAAKFVKQLGLSPDKELPLLDAMIKIRIGNYDDIKSLIAEAVLP